ncbi:MAG: nitrilase family protein [Odoribacter sp.]|nr:nitrilase family protein [Odoribacter sp.]
MSKILTVATVANDIVWGNHDENLAIVGRTLPLLDTDTDLLVLPELFSTGYVSDADALNALAQPNGGSTIRTITSLAAKYNIAIAGSFLARTGNGIYNRAFFIEPSGDETYYDKRHLFSLSSEAQTFRPGTSHIPVIRYRGWNISMIVCYDLRFPVWSRNRSNAYDLLLVPANWPVARAYAWEHLLIARAIENQCCVIGANRSGTDDYGVYDNLSFIYDAMGRSVGERLPRRSAPAPIVTARLSLDEVATARRRMPAATSADDFNLI